jgi:hypothetical protein
MPLYKPTACDTCKKLNWKTAKYTIIKVIGSYTVRFNTPLGIHNMFHVVLLRKIANNPLLL